MALQKMITTPAKAAKNAKIKQRVFSELRKNPGIGIKSLAAKLKVQTGRIEVYYRQFRRDEL